MAVLASDVFDKLLTPEQRKAADKRGEELIAEYRTLQQLRKARDLTQAQLAELWGKDQVSISQLEKRADMLLSTLRSYVEAMGGELDLVVRFEGGPPVTLSGLSTGDLREKSAR
ncbi:XRE family transcriptional regulator [Rhizobium sp. LjRoot254]|uniref:XRE family transcriptional regulator n=1 Tax=Rhizobium sp. LjRoot254 TaxID=3342297 RepID=UPI003ECC38F0